MKIVFTAKGPGGNAEAALNVLGTAVFIGAGNMTVKEAYGEYNSGSLEKA